MNMKLKTISGHYDTVYSIAHNNRTFIPSNVDAARIGWNYNRVAAGEAADIDPEQPRDLREFWRQYRELSDLYWSERSIHQTMAYRKYLEQQKEIRRYYQTLHEIPNNPVSALITLFFLPILIPCGIYLHHQHKLVKEAYDEMIHEQWLRDLSYKATKASLRSALYTHDLRTGTKYLRTMDSLVREMMRQGQIYIQTHAGKEIAQPKEYRYATLEEIYDKLYEPAFHCFQEKQRPCRRYHGTYLEQIREQKARENQKKQQTKNRKSRTTSEAIEIVFTIGDMDNTGYAAAYEDAKMAEELLRDYCDYLLTQPNVCVITTKELNDPNWEPPFKNGLIVLNLTVHADEATPGIHLTCIPYSRDCKRGPSIQASLGKAMAGMGYPSTWKDVLDEKGKKIPKKSKNGEIIYNQDNSIRYKQTPDKQGILDWIEAQKQWIQSEMRKRYQWERTYKGSHPRGNLSTPDYQAARAQERLLEKQKSLISVQKRTEETEQILKDTLDQYQNRINDLSLKLYDEIDQLLEKCTQQEIIERYLKLCPDEDYDALAEQANNWLEQLAIQERQRVYQSLMERIRIAEERRKGGNGKGNTPISER